ncbi:HNH endonuclease [Salinisphaera sp. PC39]|uniref:HTH domain-containing protein n=1 Tax=Salinisphaera sp. PC39 TaxID=1304156 RepID=UPI0033418121
MRKNSKQSISSGDDSINVIAGRDVNLYLEGNIPIELVDQKTDEEVEKLRKSRFFLEFDRTRSSLRLGRSLAEGGLSGGSGEVRGRALAWCARLLSPSEDLERAEEFLELAKTLGDFPEAKIAEAFIISQKGDKAAALNALADIDSDVSHSAGLMIVAHHDGAEGALRWMDDAGYTIADLDSDGKSFLLSHQLQLGRWDEVAQTVGALSGPDFEETPILHHLAGLATLVPTVPGDFRAVVLTQVPFEAADFRLASDAAAMDARRAAHAHFLDAVEAAKQLACPRAARTDDEYALWLELRDPAQSAHGKNRLENKLRDPSTALGFVHYALQFGIKVDLGAVERGIERSIAINGGMTIDAAIARFALAFMQRTPEEAANYIARHHNQLAAHIDAKLMRYRQIEMLSRAGLIERANEVLGRLLEEGIPADHESNLRRIISEAQGSDPIESHKAQYEATRALGDLVNLVAELEDHQHWEDLCEFGRLLFEETHSLSDAERLVNAFNNTHRSEALVCFLKENTDLLSQSNHLRMSYAWGLYHEGAFLESRAALAELSDDVGSPNYRALQVNLGIATGNWASLSAHIADEYQNRDDRSAHDLIGAAQLALHLGSPLAKDLVFEAAAKADDDSAVLAAAYFIATSAGWEDDPRIFQWLEKAAELSGDDGPLQRMSLKDILDRKPEWDRRESETWRLLAQGQIPIFLAAQSLNRTLIDLTTLPAVANLMETDPRRRSAIPAYSGKRVPLEFDVSGKALALDATALLTLSFLKILDVALDAFETVYIPHSTLGWLFEERQKAMFHQPSRIANARKVRDLLAMGVLEEFTPSTVASSDLSAQVGDELAALIAEAEKVRDGDDTQYIVVRSAPVHRLSSLMEEEADLSAHTAVLSSCLAVVEKLRQKGQVTSDEQKRARAYLQLHEKPWPNQPDIADGATLYLDDLAISYLLHLGLLGKLKAAGLTAVASPREVSEADALISYERISGEVKDFIEHIRASLNSRIESGHVKVSSRRDFDELETKSMPEHPSVGILALAPQCDVSIIDDRFLNQHANIDSGGAQAPVFSTLDLLDALVAAGVLSDEDRLEHRTRLRRAGYFFIPVSVEELERCLRESTVAQGEVVETAELKAVRESVLRVRMSDWLRLPEEAPWLDGTLKAFVRVLRNLWEDGADIEEITARSNWLVEQIDVRGWAHSLVPENADNVVRIGRAAHILLLLTPPTGVQQSVVDVYWNWVEERILVPIQEQFPEVYEWLVDWHRSHVAEMAETELSEGDNS